MKKLLILICCVGFCFANADIDKKVKELQEKCESGKYKNCFELAVMYENNPFAPQMHDKDKAAKYYNEGLQILDKACANGDVKKCLEVGSFYLNGSFSEKNGDKAYEYFKKGCFELKSGEACYIAGLNYKTAKDETKAAEFTEESCKLKYPMCLYEKQAAEKSKRQ